MPINAFVLAHQKVFGNPIGENTREKSRIPLKFFKTKFHPPEFTRNFSKGGF